MSVNTWDRAFKKSCRGIKSFWIDQTLRIQLFILKSLSAKMSDSLTGVQSAMNVAAISGPLLIGYLLHWGLFGALCMQIYLYYIAFPNDRAMAKALAYGVYILEVIETGLITQSAYAAYGSGFGNPGALLDLQLTWLAIPIMGAIVAFVGQMFFAWRIHVLSKSLYIPFVVLAFSVTSSTAGIVTGIYALEAGKLNRMNSQKETISASLWCGSSALCDLVIAASMTFYLSKIKNGFKRTEAMIRKLIRVTVETGTMTAAIASLCLILFLSFPNTTYYSSISLIIPKTYANTIFVILNSRMQIKNGRDPDFSTAMSAEAMTVPTFLFRDSGPPLPGSTVLDDHPRQSVRTRNLSISTLSSPVAPVSAYVSSNHDLLRYPEYPPVSRFSTGSC
uniref:DUF6534 domain-containing protein n=1 Tax=Moniliophthora roreri TaxID=221103 RepID=A0A0W0G027_MONRR